MIKEYLDVFPKKPISENRPRLKLHIYNACQTRLS